ncbi:MAG: hypothetical protein IT294_00880 [Deltaproteobacteria bacterium]|nr:hypothetical protein [Deltaproteobacteria bacterium]
MKILKQFVFIAAAVAVSAVPALAGTKYATNLVSNSAIDPPANPTLSPKSQIKMSDKGDVSVSLSGVTDVGGLPLTTSTVYTDSLKDAAPGAILDGSEYVVIIKLYLPAIAGPPLLIPGVEVPVAVGLKNGKGKTKMSLAGLLTLLPPGYGRSIEVAGAEVWGQLGGAPEAANCMAVINNTLPATLGFGDPSCRGLGAQSGMSGLAIP